MPLTRLLHYIAWTIYRIITDLGSLWNSPLFAVTSADILVPRLEMRLISTVLLINALSPVFENDIRQ